MANTEQRPMAQNNTVSQADDYSSGWFEKVTTGSLIGMTFLFTGSMAANYWYTSKNAEAIGRTVDADDMHLEGPFPTANGLLLHEHVTGMSLNIGKCVLDGVSADVTRDKSGAITDTSHYTFDAQSAPEATDPVQTTTYRFENPADLGEDFCEQLGLETTQ